MTAKAAVGYPAKECGHMHTAWAQEGRRNENKPNWDFHMLSASKDKGCSIAATT
jgi:hypothetical protein